MATVREIPPRKKELSLKKVAAYCRFSAKAQNQLDGLTAQERYYEEQINGLIPQNLLNPYISSFESPNVSCQLFVLILENVFSREEENIHGTCGVGADFFQTSNY